MERLQNAKIDTGCDKVLPISGRYLSKMWVHRVTWLLLLYHNINYALKLIVNCIFHLYLCDFALFMFVAYSFATTNKNIKIIYLFVHANYNS